VGCGGLKTHAPGEGELKRMFVAPDCRGRGHARRILTALEDAARALGHRRLVLDTAAPLQEAMALYTKAGYRRIEAYNDNRYAAAWFEKQLSSK
jgi:GNAT superfamily N-acetyltransferase